MAILDALKKKRKVSKEVSKKPKLAEKLGKLAQKVSSRKEEEKETKPREKKEGEKKRYTFSYKILKEPHITEKSTKLNESNKYVFRVYPSATKTEIKKSIESLYGVDVLKVRTITIPKKKRRLGRTQGFKKGYKKQLLR
ncbi:MAG TPA: 50S ribosomal protein L23 [Candidatus Omnitrophica bacterium]|nr:50S ribosomal protein L23 [Candidatus Omnitrophota bacterium]